MTILSNFDFSNSVSDQVESNSWANQLNVYRDELNGYLTAASLGVLGTCYLSGINEINLTFTPEASTNISSSGILLLGEAVTFQLVWSPTEESLAIRYTFPLEEPDPEEEQSGHREESFNLSPGVEYSVRVTLGSNQATLFVNNEQKGQLEIDNNFSRVQVLCSSGTKFKSLVLSSED